MPVARSAPAGAHTWSRYRLGMLQVDRLNGGGRAVLFVHGASAGPWCWRGFMARFAAAGYDCHALALRGHPPSNPMQALGRVRLLDYVSDIHHVLERLPEAVLIGHSMGGALVQAVAATCEVAALILAAPAPVAGVRFYRPPWHPWFPVQAVRALPAVLGRGVVRPHLPSMRRMVFNRLPREQHQQVFSRCGPESSTALLGLLRGRLNHELDSLQGRAFKRLVVAGTADRICVFPMQREIARYQGAELLVLIDRAHMFMIEPGWERCADWLLSWLQRALTTA
ncbi:alpha/beta hydrolase [Nitrococcus mobilis]|uniref:Alpha/beta hydrolase fold protein n=1 Tax=Nitrococcus mobilis Nb-231 TaxID=314278 RepID=A4BQ83_9GAMM|nr:alpha/beta hydrolase [Nitrococcus mobilis]EAR22238.1 Alpha/beta hydrolase fold protein [Nitrococcus mobilis Nb-231]